MRHTRKAEEHHFAQIFSNWYQTRHDRDARELPDITDRPDMAIETLGKKVAIELSQIPSSYFIKRLHRKMPTPVYAEDRITGQLVVYPFEPHRWVHEVIKKKEGKADAYRAAIGAHEAWLVMHCPSKGSDWPMTGPSNLATRQAEALLMRFGLKGSGSKFERIFFVYADGDVIELTVEAVPTAISLPDGSGYPALTTHQFSLGLAVPLPGMGIREHRFDTISFEKTIIAPIDDWMAGASPQIEEPIFKGKASVSSEYAQWEISRNGNVIHHERMPVSAYVGQMLYLHLLLEWGIQKTTFNCCL